MSTRSKNGTAKRTSTVRAASPRREGGVSYDAFKEYEGRRYTGMQIGRGHTWRYDPGNWKETKITPDLWQIRYEVTKRRAGRAPEGSGVPVGTDYHWYIVGHQYVCKLNANDYTTSLTGLKFKVAHKRADTGAWSATPATQRKRMITFLKQVIDELEHPSTTAPDDSLATTDSATGPSATTRRRKTATPPSIRKPTRRRTGARVSARAS
jgi:hypothetical protein